MMAKAIILTSNMLAPNHEYVRNMWEESGILILKIISSE